MNIVFQVVHDISIRSLEEKKPGAAINGR